MRLIDADATRGELWMAGVNTEVDGVRGVWVRFKEIEKIFDHAPTVDPVKHGRWRKMNGERGYECSECGWESDTTWDFCPNCGALNIEAWENTDEEGE